MGTALRRDLTRGRLVQPQRPGRAGHRDQDQHAQRDSDRGLAAAGDRVSRAQRHRGTHDRQADAELHGGGKRAGVPHQLGPNAVTAPDFTGDQPN